MDKGSLYANSVMGSSELRKTGEDLFEIVAYSGAATFKRNADTKAVNAVKIEVGDLVMEGVRVEGLFISRTLLIH